VSEMQSSVGITLHKYSPILKITAILLICEDIFFIDGRGILCSDVDAI